MKHDDINTNSVIPEVGMGVTICSHSDKYPFTIIGVSENKKTITIQQDIAKRIDDNGLSENQTYDYKRDVNGLILKARINKEGIWTVIGNKYKTVIIGEREKYWNPSF